MAQSTTIKLPDQLKERIAPLAESAGKSPHAWMIEALETQATLAEKRKDFLAEATAAEREVRESGMVYRAEDVHRYLAARVAGRKVRRPKAVKR